MENRKKKYTHTPLLDARKRLEMKKLYRKGATLTFLAKTYGVSITTVWKVKEKEAWAS